MKNIACMLAVCSCLWFALNFAQAQTSLALPTAANNAQNPCISAELEQEIQREVQANLSYLRSIGRILPLEKTTLVDPPKFRWPMEARAGFDDFDYYTITNFRDNNRSKKDSIDWNGGKRTYDQHEGMDIALNPFSWTQMDEMVVDVVAAAPGVLVVRHDGEFDRNCVQKDDAEPNYVVLRHDDGHFSLYLHLKKGTVIDRAIGSVIAEGEYLGKPGSSGRSTGPHLHFDVRKPNGTLDPGDLETTIDPYQGPHGNTQSFWRNQKPYFEPGVLRILTTEPSGIKYASCPATKEDFLEVNHYSTSDVLYAHCLVRDVRVGNILIYTLFDPNGNAVKSGLNVFEKEYYNLWQISFKYNFADNPVLGTWKIVVNFGLREYAHYFTLGCPTDQSFTKPISGNFGSISGGKITSTAKIENGYVRYEAANTISLLPGFSVGNGSVFKGIIDPCFVRATLVATNDVDPAMENLEVFPNPFTGSAKIKYTLLSNQTSSIQVYSATGQLSATPLPVQTQTAGEHELNFQAENLPAGLYFLVLQTGQSRSTKRIVIHH
jgi:murein DD-endopeptidase MepM/ murein hydrolase activator NlpD